MRHRTLHAPDHRPGFGAGLLVILAGLSTGLFLTTPASAETVNASPALSAWDVVHTPDTWEKACAQTPSGPEPGTSHSEQLLNLTLGMKDVQVVCTLLRAYSTNTDVPVRWKDDYDPTGDAIWREQLRQDCVNRHVDVTGCVERSVRWMRAGTDPGAKALPYRDGIDPRGSDSLADWNQPDATLIEFTWTPCTPFLVQRGLARWRAQHLNIVTTGSDPVRLDQPPIPANPLRPKDAGSLPTFPSRSDRQDDRRDRGDVRGEERNAGDSARNAANACLRGVTVRTSVRDRWANYAHVLLRETAPADDQAIVPFARQMLGAPEKPIPCETGDKPSCAIGIVREGATNDDKNANLPSRRFNRASYAVDNLVASDGRPFEPLFRSGYVGGDSAYMGEAPVSTVTDIEWRNTWTNRQQWLVLVRDHFFARLRTQSLVPSYALPEFGKLVYCEGPDVQYGSIPSGKQYYWHNTAPDGNKGCYWQSGPVERAYDPKGDYLQLNISYVPDATLQISHGPLYHEYWERAQARFVGRAVERLARYNAAAPLVQNDRDPLAADQPAPLGPKACPHPLPVNGNGRKCNAEAPPRDAVSPRFGDVYTGPEAPGKASDAPAPAKGS